MMSRPERNEAAEYYYTYIDQVDDGDIRDLIEQQSAETLTVLRTIDEAQSRQRYAPDKWTIAEVASHVNDTERLFVFRAMWFARGFDSPLPSFDQNIALASAGADARPWASHVDEFAAVRSGTAAFFRHLPADAWTRRGIASGNPFTVRALAYVTAGHVNHHAAILRTRYLQR